MLPLDEHLVICLPQCFCTRDLPTLSLAYEDQATPSPHGMLSAAEKYEGTSSKMLTPPLGGDVLPPEQNSGPLQPIDARNTRQGKRSKVSPSPREQRPQLLGRQDTTRVSPTGRKLSHKETVKLNQQRFESRHQQNAEEIRLQAAALRQKLKEQERAKRWVARPDRHKWLGVWDSITSFALIYTATVTPFETCFIESASGLDSWTDFWFLTNRVLDVIFTADMFLQFRVAYQSYDKHGTIFWVEDATLVAKHYAQTWFLLDAFTVIVPGTLDIYGTLPAANNTSDDGSGKSPGGVLRVLRVLRLIKLVRLVRASRVIQRWKSKVALSYGVQTMLVCFFGLVIAAHWYACVLAMMASLHDHAENTWLGDYNFCNQEHRDYLVDSGLKGSIRGVAVSLGGCEIDVGTLYASSWALAVLIITGTGGSDALPAHDSTYETVCITTLLLFGAFMWTMILASFCDVASNGNPGSTNFRQNLDGLNEFMEHHHLPVEMRRRLREYMHQQKSQMLLAFSHQAIPLLSPGLQVEVILQVHRHWIQKVWFLKKTEQICQVRVALAMKLRTFAPNDIAPQRFLFVMHRGLVVFGGRVLSRGMCWGDDVILSDNNYFLPYLARAMTYVDVGMLGRDLFMSIISEFPDSFRVVRRATILLALRRHVVAAARRKKSVERAAHEEGFAFQGVDFLAKLNNDYEHDSRQHKQKDGVDETLSSSLGMSRRAMADAVISLDSAIPQGSGGGGGGGGGGEADADMAMVLDAIDRANKKQNGQLVNLDQRISYMQEDVSRRMDSFEVMINDLKSALSTGPAMVRGARLGRLPTMKVPSTDASSMSMPSEAAADATRRAMNEREAGCDDQSSIDHPKGPQE